MSDAPNVTPALTPEVWSQIGVRCLIVPIGRDGQAGMYALDGQPVHVPNQHVLAALALHGQPFGFTHEDVTLLRRLAYDAEAGVASTDFYLGGMMEAPDPVPFRALAVRIAALLPPTP